MPAAPTGFGLRPQGPVAPRTAPPGRSSLGLAGANLLQRIAEQLTSPRPAPQGLPPRPTFVRPPMRPPPAIGIRPPLANSLRPARPSGLIGQPRPATGWVAQPGRAAQPGSRPGNPGTSSPLRPVGVRVGQLQRQSLSAPLLGRQLPSAAEPHAMPLARPGAGTRLQHSRPPRMWTARPLGAPTPAAPEQEHDPAAALIADSVRHLEDWFKRTGGKAFCQNCSRLQLEVRAQHRNPNLRCLSSGHIRRRGVFPKSSESRSKRNTLASLTHRHRCQAKPLWLQQRRRKLRTSRSSSQSYQLKAVGVAKPRQGRCT